MDSFIFFDTMKYFLSVTTSKIMKNPRASQSGLSMSGAHVLFCKYTIFYVDGAPGNIFFKKSD